MAITNQDVCILTTVGSPRSTISGVWRSSTSSSPLLLQESSSGFTEELEPIPQWDLFARVGRLEAIIFTKEDARRANIETKEAMDEMKEEARQANIERKEESRQANIERKEEARSAKVETKEAMDQI